MWNFFLLNLSESNFILIKINKYQLLRKKLALALLIEKWKGWDMSFLSFFDERYELSLIVKHNIQMISGYYCDTIPIFFSLPYQFTKTIKKHLFSSTTPATHLSHSHPLMAIKAQHGLLDLNSFVLTEAK